MSKINKQDVETFAIIAVVGIGLYLVYKMFSGVSNIFGGAANALGGGKEGASVDKSLQDRDSTPKAQDPWSPEYSIERVKAGMKIPLLKGAAKKDLIAKIIDDTGWAQWFENGGKLVSLFKTIGHKSQISDLANAYKQSQGTDMLTDIKNRMQQNLGGWLSNAEVNKNLNDLLSYVDKLPE